LESVVRDVHGRGVCGIYSWYPAAEEGLLMVGLFTLYTHMMRQRRKVLGTTRDGNKSVDRKER